jgi:hypothetical protein
MSLSLNGFSLDRIVNEIDAAVDAGICRHCVNTRVPVSPTICVECARCTDASGCQHSPTCYTRDPDYVAP